MAYSPATRLTFSMPGSEGNWAIVLSENNVKCLSGTYKGETMKLIDWLILAGGKESTQECYAGEAAAVWKHAQIKAGLLNDPTEVIDQQNLDQQNLAQQILAQQNLARQKLALENLAHVGAMWMTAQEKYSEDTYNNHY